VRLEGFEPPTF